MNFSFRVGCAGSGLSWIPITLSTLKRATSPHLSAIQLNFVWQPSADQSVETAIEDAGDDLRWIADEVAQIKCEFEGTVDLSVVRDPGFNTMFDKLNVRFHFRGIDPFSFLPLQILQHHGPSR